MEPKNRRHPRLKEYDYSQNGSYFVTICTQNRLPLLSRVGRGLAPAVAPTVIGEIAMEQLMALELRYRYLHIEKYVIMPNHIHLLLALEAAGASPRPTGLTAENCDRHTLPEIIGAFKSITTRLCNAAAALPGRKLFQTSFYEEVIRSQAQYLECWLYIENNPVLWAGDEYFEE